MQDLEKKRILLLRLCAIFLALIFLLMLVGCFALFRSYLSVSERLREADSVIRSLQNIAGQLERIDWVAFSDSVSSVTSALDEAQLAEIASQLRTVSASLASIDWEMLATDASESMQLAQESLTEVMGTLDEMDIEALNQAIRDLQTVIEPLARLMGK